MVQKSCLIALLVLALSSCGATQKPTEIVTKPVQVSIKQIPDPKPIVMNDIRWKVINTNDKIYYGLTVADYQLLAINMLELKRYITEQKNIIYYYKDNTNN